MNYHLIRVLGIIVTALGLTTTAQADVTIAPQHYQISSSQTLNSLESSVHSQIDRYRQSRNLPALELDPVLSAQARLYSQEMARSGKLQHHKVSAAEQNAYPSAAENIATNFNHPNPDDIAVQGWISSIPHEQNITGKYNATGIGVAKNDRGQYYFTQIFVRR